MTIASGQAAPAGRVPALVEQFKGGLAAPICLTWEWTYACNLSCTHCLSSSGRRDPGELLEHPHPDPTALIIISHRKRDLGDAGLA